MGFFNSMERLSRRHNLHVSHAASPPSGGLYSKTPWLDSVTKAVSDATVQHNQPDSLAKVAELFFLLSGMQAMLLGVCGLVGSFLLSTQSAQVTADVTFAPLSSLVSEFTAYSCITSALYVIFFFLYTRAAALTTDVLDVLEQRQALQKLWIFCWAILQGWALGQWTTLHQVLPSYTHMQQQQQQQQQQHEQLQMVQFASFISSLLALAFAGLAAFVGKIIYEDSKMQL